MLCKILPKSSPSAPPQEGGTMGYCDLEIPEHKTQLNFHQKETQHKSTKQNIIEQSQQGLQTEGVRCQAEGQEEEGELGKWKGGREGGRTSRDGF